MPNKILWWRLIILKEIDAQLWDTAGQEEFERIRILSYENTTCFIVCFCVADYVTFDNVKKLWLPELRRHNPEAKVLLVGTKSDMRIPKAEKRRDDGKRGKTLRNKEVFYYKIVCQNFNLLKMKTLFIFPFEVKNMKRHFVAQVSERKIKDIVREEKLDGYVECSALANGGEKIDDVFQSAARLSLIQLGITSEPEDTTSKSENGLGCIIGWNIYIYISYKEPKSLKIN